MIIIRIFIIIVIIIIILIAIIIIIKKTIILRQIERFEMLGFLAQFSSKIKMESRNTVSWTHCYR